MNLNFFANIISEIQYEVKSIQMCLFRTDF